VNVTKEAFAQGITDTIINYSQLRTAYEQTENGAHSAIDSKLLEERMLKEIQKQEYLEAKHMDEEKKRQEREAETKRIQEEENERIKAEEAQRQREELIRQKRSTIPLEPEPNTAGSSEIVFRFSSGKRLIRRFPKTCTIQVQFNIIIDTI